MDLPMNSILSTDIEVDILSHLPAIYHGPRSVILYTNLQGFFTVLIIKEVVSLMIYAVKGSRKDLSVNKILIWNIVEDWEDLYKVFKKHFWQPRRMHTDLYEDRRFHNRVPLDTLGRKRFFLAAIVALVIFGTEMIFVICAVPNRFPQNARLMQKIRLKTSSEPFSVTSQNIIVGSFSRVVKFNAPRDDIEFNRLPSVSIERTDFLDFNQTLPAYNGDLFHCTKREQWRILCKVFCNKRFYQYKIRLDVSTDTDDSFFFVNTTDIDFSNFNVHNYVDQIEKQLGINISQGSLNSSNDASNNAFWLKTDPENMPGERTPLPIDSPSSDHSNDPLTHDAIATIFLGSIFMERAPINTLYHARNSSAREEKVQMVEGTVAISQRPTLPLYGTIIIYGMLQVISIVLQKSIKLHTLAPEVGLMMEVTGGSCFDNWANADLSEMQLIRSTTTRTVDRQTVGHIGYLPAIIVAQIRKFLRSKNRFEKHIDYDNEFRIIDQRQLEDLAEIGGTEEWDT